MTENLLSFTLLYDQRAVSAGIGALAFPSEFMLLKTSGIKMKEWRISDALRIVRK